MQNATPKGWRSACLRWSLASQQVGPVVAPPCLPQAPPTGFPFLKGRFVGGCSCRAPAVLWGWPESFQQPVHHWHPLNSNLRAVHARQFFQRLKSHILVVGFESYSSSVLDLLKTIESASTLAHGAVMRAAARHHNPPNRRPADPAWPACAPVDPVFQLEQAAHPVCIHII